MSDRYRLVRALGKGGMAEVFLAVAVGAEGFEKPVAIKRALPQMASDPEAAQMFIAEAKLAMHLHHQNVVEVSDVGRDSQGLYVVMELVNGWDLAVVLERAKEAGVLVPEPLAVFIAEQVNAGLAYAHRQTLQGQPLIAAHRDVSPGNVLLSKEGEVKLGDFGIAKAAAAKGTDPGTFKGKVPYSSPEMVWGKPATAHSDQFSVGVVLCEMLTGRMPFGEHANLALYAQALAQNQPVALPSVEPALASVVRQMLAIAPSARFPFDDDVATALSNVLARRGARGTARELARFLASLKLPATPLELGTDAALISSPVPVEDWHPSGPVMDVSGKLERPKGIEITKALSVLPKARPVQAEVLELDRPASPEIVVTPSPPVETFDAAPRSPPRLGRAFLVIAVIAVLATGAWYGLTHRQWVEVSVARLGVPGLRLPAPELPVLRIESEPEGATIRVDGEVLGQTPLVRENDFPDREIPVTLTRKGYQPWTGTFVGGIKASVEAKLKR